jgi:ATP-dependent DNA ligase
MQDLLNTPSLDTRAVQIVSTFLVGSDALLNEAHATFVSKNFEGTMLRDPESFYLPGKRSPGLLKKKDWHDDEFKIVAITEGQGKNKGAAVIECQVKPGVTFTVTAQGPYPQKRQIYRKREEYIGKFLQVRYQNLTDDGKPRFPEAIRFAEEKDIIEVRNTDNLSPKK